MYITNLGIRITHLQNSFQVQQMARDAAPSRGTTRLKHFHQPEEPHTDSPCLSISKAPGKNLSLGHLAGEWIPKQLSTFSIILEVQRKKKKKPCKIYLGTLHRSIESTLFDWPDLLVTTLSEQPCPLWWPQTLVQQCTNTELLLENKAARHHSAEDIFQLTSWAYFLISLEIGWCVSDNCKVPFLKLHVGRISTTVWSLLKAPEEMSWQWSVLAAKLMQCPSVPQPSAALHAPSTVLTQRMAAYL